MKEPQLEDGYTRINNHTLEHLAKIQLNSSEFNIILVVIRLTWGFNKKSDTISISQIVKHTNLSKRAVIRSINSLVDKNLLIKEQHPKGNVYMLNKYTEGWRCKWNGNRGVTNLSHDKIDTKGGDKIVTHKRNIYKENNIDISNDISKELDWKYFWESFTTIMDLDKKSSNKEIPFIRMLYNSYADVLDDAMIELCEMQLAGRIKDINHARSFLRYKCQQLADRKKPAVVEQRSTATRSSEGVKVLYEKPEPMEFPTRNLFAEYLEGKGKLPN